MPPINRQLLDFAIRHAIYLERLKTTEVRAAIAFLNDSVLPDLMTQLDRRLTTFGTRRLATMFKDTQGIILDGMRELDARTTGRLQALGLYESKWQSSIVNRLMPRGVNVSMSSISPDIVKAIVTSDPMNGHILRDWFKSLGTTTQHRLKQQINIGLVEGEAIPDIVDRVRGTKALSYKDGVIGGTKRQVEAIVRTAVNHVTTRAREETYEENSTIVDQVRWVSTLDARTTPVCKDRDGELFNVGEGSRPPAHFNCRSTTVPVIKGWEDLGLKSPPASTRATLDGQAPEALTYNDWLKGQSAAVQDEALGPTRAELFRSGQADVHDFVDDRGQLMTLAQLAKKEGLSLN